MPSRAPAQAQPAWKHRQIIGTPSFIHSFDQRSFLGFRNSRW